MNTDAWLPDAVRVALLLLTAPVAMLAVKFGYVGLRRGAPIRAWAAAAFLLLLTTPTLLLLRFEEPLPWVATAVHAAGLGCAAAALYTLYTVHPEWTRARLAAEREAESDRLAVVREEQDDLRTEDRKFQAGERADSRDMYDAGHLTESDATYDRRVEAREEQDENRAHSHQLQDDERATVRSDEDDRL